MARMHSRRKGVHGSTKPSVKTLPKWVEISKGKIEDLVESLRKDNKSYSEIGIVLRDSYGVPSVKAVTGKRVGKIISEKGLTHKFPEDLMTLMKRAVGLKKHLVLNKHDLHNKRSLQLIESKIHRLVKYYDRTGKIPKGWTYSYDTAKLLVE